MEEVAPQGKESAPETQPAESLEQDGEAGSLGAGHEALRPFSWKLVEIKEPDNNTWTALAAIREGGKNKPETLLSANLGEGVLAHGMKGGQSGHVFRCGSSVRFAQKKQSVTGWFIVGYVPPKGMSMASICMSDETVRIVQGHQLAPDSKGGPRLFASDDDLHVFVQSGVDAMDEYLGKVPAKSEGQEAAPRKSTGKQETPNRRQLAPLSGEERENLEKRVAQLKSDLSKARSEAAEASSALKELVRVQAEMVKLEGENKKLQEEVALLQVRLEEKTDALDRLEKLAARMAPRGRSPPPPSPERYHYYHSSYKDETPSSWDRHRRESRKRSPSPSRDQDHYYPRRR